MEFASFVFVVVIVGSGIVFVFAPAVVVAARLLEPEGRVYELRTWRVVLWSSHYIGVPKGLSRPPVAILLPL